MGKDRRALEAPDPQLWSTAWYAMAVALLLPDAQDAGPGLRRQDLLAQLEWLEQLDGGHPMRGGAFGDGSNDTNSPLNRGLRFLERHPEVVGLEVTGPSNASEGSSNRYRRRVEGFPVAPLPASEAEAIVDALCWLLRGLHHDTTEQGRRRLDLPPTVTALSRVLAALLQVASASEATRSLHLRALAWFPGPHGQLALADTAVTPPSQATWPPYRFQAVAYDRLGRGRPPKLRWPAERAALLRALVLACRDAARCKITYTSASSGRRLDLEVDPWYLAPRRGAWYLLASDEGQDPRVYRLERIVGLEVGEPASRLSQPEATVARAAMRLDPDVGEPAVLRTHAAHVAPLAGSVLREHDGAASTFEVAEAGAFQLRSWALSAAPDAEVVDPAGVRAEIEEVCERIAARHEGPASDVVPGAEEASLPNADGVQDERQFAAMLSLFAWDALLEIDVDERYSEIATHLAAASLGLGEPPAGLATFRDALGKVPDEAFVPPEGYLPIVALTYEERVALQAVLQRARRLALPEGARHGLGALRAWLEPVLAGPELLTLDDDGAPSEEARARGAWLAQAAAAGRAVELTTEARDGSVETLVFSPWWFAATVRDELVSGFDHALGEQRWVRLRRVRRLGESTAPYRLAPLAEVAPALPPGQLSQPGAEVRHCRLLLDPQAWWLLDELPPERWPEDASGGPVVVEAADVPAYLHRLVMRGAGHAEILEPEEDRLAMGEIARACRQRHGPGS